VTLTDHRENDFGNLWNSVPVTMRNWELEIQFQIEGTANDNDNHNNESDNNNDENNEDSNLNSNSNFDSQSGGDGLVFWLTSKKLDFTSPAQIFLTLSNEDFSGLAIVMDTRHPTSSGNDEGKDSIYVVVRNGTLDYGDDTQIKFPGCSFQIRNSGLNTLGIRYQRQILTVWRKSGASEVEQEDWQICLRGKFDLPRNHYYFGWSASTGNRSRDRHEVLTFNTFEIPHSNLNLNLEPQPQSQPQPRHADEHESESESEHENDDHGSPYELESRSSSGTGTGTGTGSHPPGDQSQSVQKSPPTSDDSDNNTILVLPLIVFIAFVAFGVFGLSISSREELDT